VRVVGHTSRTGSVRGNEILSRQRAEAVRRMLERDNRALATKLSATGVGSREALVGLGTDDVRDALDRRVEFRVVDCV
jgi:outer membrane protein OmpA-like peptidoglycan-associated protein